MTEQETDLRYLEEFEELWEKTEPHAYLYSKRNLALLLYKECFDKKQAIIDQQAAELAALRGFAKDFFEYYRERDKSEIFTSLALQHGLIDETGKPTPLLTGEK